MILHKKNPPPSPPLPPPLPAINSVWYLMSYADRVVLLAHSRLRRRLCQREIIYYVLLMFFFASTRSHLKICPLYSGNMTDFQGRLTVLVKPRLKDHTFSFKNNTCSSKIMLHEIVSLCSHYFEISQQTKTFNFTSYSLIVNQKYPSPVGGRSN